MAVRTKEAPQAIEDSVVVVHGLSATSDGFYATLEVINDDPALCRGDILKFNAKGDTASTVASAALPASLTERGLPAFSSLKADGLPLAAINGEEAPHVSLLGKGSSKLEAAFEGVDMGPAAHCVADKNFLVVVCDRLDPEGFPVQEVYTAKLSLKSPKLALMDLPGLGLTLRRTISAITLWNDALYIAVVDAVAGFDLFTVDLKAKDPEAKLVFDQGAFRFSLNAAVPCMLATEDALLIGTAALASSELALGTWGAELIALDKDGQWSLIFGQNRFSPHGLKMSVTGAGAGIDNVDNSSLAAMARRDGEKGEEVFVLLQEYWGDPHSDRDTVMPVFSDYFGDVRLFKSTPGTGLVDWEEVEVELPEDHGAVSSMCCTKEGLVIAHEQDGDEGYPLTIVAV
ncbi:MAG: hypothetical protein AAGI03_02890 [Pseudomonadota bacterium]